MLLAVLALLAAPPALAPLTTSFDPLAKGSIGLSFGFPAGGATTVGTGSTVGVTYFMNDNFAVRADFGIDAVVSPSGTPVVFDIGLGVRAYQFRRGPVALYLFPQLSFGRVNPGGAAGASEFINISGGAGAEYFFADHFSVGGQLGIGLNFGNIGGPAGSSVVTQITTATSGLFASVYF